MLYWDMSLLNREQVLYATRKMIAIRYMEERCAGLYQSRKIAGFCHLYIGQEAILGALSLIVRPEDSVITGYRAHGFLLLKNDDIEEVATLLIGELTGKVIGCSKGKGGSMHIFDVDRRFYGGHGIVGAQVPLGTGLAFAHKYNEDGGVNFAFFGDGAANQGQVYEAFNIASLWGLPVLYIIENNQYAMGTSVERGSATQDLYNRGRGFGIEGVRADGMDLFATYKALAEGAEFCRQNSRPFIVELMTYRYKGHSMSDPGKYRTREEVEEYRTKSDPIERIKSYLQEKEGVSAEELAQIVATIKVALDNAIAKCEAATEPDASELFTDVYAP